MKKYLMYLCMGIVVALLCGCSAESEEQSLKENGNIKGFEALAAGKWDDAIAVFQEEIEAEDAEVIGYLGLARAEIGAEKLEEAQATLIKANEKFPKNTSILYYLGEVSNRLEDYAEATDCYYSLMKLVPEDKLAEKRLTENLWKTSDFEKIYSISKELYELDPEGKNALKNLLWACSVAGIDTHIEEVLDTVRNSKSEYPTQTLYEAYQAAKIGNLEQASQILFQSEHQEELCQEGRLYLGDCDSEGNGNGIGVGVQNIFGEKGAVIGKWKDGRWEGECLAWSGRTGTSTTERNGVEYQGEYFYDTIYTGQWTHGAPEGVIEVKETRYSIYQGHEEYNSERRKEGEIVFKDGKAEGRTALTEYYYSDYRQEWKESSQEIHEFKEGKPQPFIVKTEKGEKTVYEAKVDPKSKGVAYDYTETPCSCQYVW